MLDTRYLENHGLCSFPHVLVSKKGDGRRTSEQQRWVQRQMGSQALWTFAFQVVLIMY